MSEEMNTNHKGPLAWMAGNSVAANLLMLVLIVGGLFVGSNIKQEVFPEFALNTVSITVEYPGATPQEVDTGIILAIEEAIQAVDGINEITSSADEGLATISVEAMDGADVNKLWQDIQSSVARIETFPEAVRSPQVMIDSRRREVITFALHGQASPLELRNTAELVRDSLVRQPNISQVELVGIRDFEVVVEISQDALRRYGLTLEDVSETIRAASVELGGGSLKTAGGEILIRMNDKRDLAEEYAQLPVLTQKDGSRLLLEDIATVEDGFEESDSWAEFNGEPAIIFEVYRSGNQQPVEVADDVSTVMQEFLETNTSKLSLSMVQDWTELFTERANLMLENAYIGLALVFIFLALFLEIRLAFWVCLGIPISILGSFLFLPFSDFTINIVTMFAFITTLGIVVDDAVVIGESIYHKRKEGLSRLDAAIQGVKSVAMPVVFSVLTNIVAFMPLYFLPGTIGRNFRTLPIVVACVFGVSLIEGLFILPAHLGHTGTKRLWGPLGWLEKKQEAFGNVLEYLIQKWYGVFLRRVIEFRYLVVAVALVLLLGTVGYLQSGRMGMVIFPKIDARFAFAQIVLPYGAPAKQVQKVSDQLIRAAQEIEQDNGGKQLVKCIYSRVSANVVQARIYLTPPDVRPLTTGQVAAEWRKKTHAISGVENLSFSSTHGGPGGRRPISIELLSRDSEQLYKAGEELAAALADFSSVSDVEDGSAQGKKQFEFTLSPLAERLGMTSRGVAMQVRNAYQGAEALIQLRGRNEVTVRVRLPREDRERVASIENLVLRSPDGEEVLLRDAVNIVQNRAFTTITRKNGQQGITVQADVSPRSEVSAIVNELERAILPDLMNRHPGLRYEFTGNQKNIRETSGSLFTGVMLAFLIIYGLLAIPFRSYTQPLIVMTSIPFGVIGAVWGLVLMGFSMSLMSLFGVVALSGVVVNGALVLIEFSNRERAKGTSVIESVYTAGVNRFRPIFLTTITTFGGLAPMVFETSTQAKFLIPMAVALGFGIVFSTLVTLALVPALYVILDDVHLWSGRLVMSCKKIST